MTRDRLGDLLKAQNKNGSGTMVDIEMVTVQKTQNDLRKTFERAEVLGQWIESVENNIVIVREYTRKADLSINQKELNDKIQSVFQNNASICQKINGKLKELEEDLKTTNADSAEGRIKSIQSNTLKTRYIKAFKDNNTELENYRNIQKANLEAQLIAKGVRVSDDELVALLDEEIDIQLFTDNILAETEEAKRILADLEERHQQLLKIERMLVEVRDLFLEMSILVDAQKELVDRVEYQAQMAKEYVGKTPKILSEAAKKKTGYLKCKIYGTIALIVLIAIILILIFK